MQVENKNSEKCLANYVALNPVSFLRRTAEVFPDRVSLVYEEKSYTWSETFERCKRLAFSLSLEGFQRGEVVGFLATNTPELYEAHFGVPMAGFVLNAINYRLDSKTIGYILKHSKTKILFVDTEFIETALNAIELMHLKIKVVQIVDHNFG